MKTLLIGLLAFSSICSFANASRLPVPCEVRCEAIRKELSNDFVVSVRWDGDQKSKRYYLVENQDFKAPEKGFHFNGKQLAESNVRIRRITDKSPLEILLPGFEGDLEIIPSSLKELMLSAEEFNLLPQVTSAGKKSCEIKTYNLNKQNEIELQILESESDRAVGLNYKGAGIWEKHADRSLSFYNQINVISKVGAVRPFAKESLSKRLLELQEIGVCESRLSP